MVKKIIDVIAPSEERKLPEEKADDFEKKLSAVVEPKRRRYFLAAGIFVFSAAAVFFLSQTKAEVEIFPQTEVLSFETKLGVSPGVVSSEIFEVEKTVSREFSATGKKISEKKAEGAIRIYNNYRSSQTLVEGTRLQAASEKFQPALEKDEKPWFKTLSKITISSKSYVDVKVVAVSPGEKYNIKPAKFSIPGLAGTPQYTLVYGESFQEFQGGSKKEAPQVSAADLEKAESEVSAAAKEAGFLALKEKIPAEFGYFEDGFKTDILETFSAAAAGADLEKFSSQAKAKTRTIAFKKVALEKFAREFVFPKISEGKKIDEGKFKIGYSLYSVDNQLSKMTVLINVEAGIYSIIDEDFLKKGLIAKTALDAKSFLESQSQIKTAKIKLWPFWVKSIPGGLDGIKLRVTLD